MLAQLAVLSGAIGIIAGLFCGDDRNIGSVLLRTIITGVVVFIAIVVIRDLWLLHVFLNNVVTR